MTPVQFTNDQLKEAATTGEKQAARALSVLAKRSVDVTTKEASIVDATEVKHAVEAVSEQAVLAYTKALTGISAISVLSMERSDALNLVDLFNNRPAGMTMIMQELDRSTIRETLNILSNAYVTELAKLLHTTVMLSVPSMITKQKLNDVAELAGIRTGERAVLFETELAVSGVGFQVKLYFFFLTGERVTT